MADTIKTNLGPVTAYADAKAHGYTGTREEFGALLANAGLNLKAAETAKEGAEVAKQAAETAQKAAAENQKNAETQAANAKASADTAAGQANAAKESATGAANSASAAKKSETNAGQSATAASNAEAAAKQAQQAAETAKTDAEAAKTAAGNSADAAAASAADAKNTLESIPADYSALSGKVDENANGIRELKEDTAALQKRQNVLVGSETGNPVSCDDAFAAPLCGLTVYGKSTQDGTPTPDAPVPIASVGDGGSVAVKVTGANILEETAPGIRGIQLGVTYAADENGISFTGTSTGTVSIYLHRDLKHRLPRGTYYLTAKGLSTSVVLNFFYVGKFTSDLQNQKIILTNDVEYSLALQAKEGITVNTIIQVSLTKNKITHYSPYSEQLLTLQTPTGLPGIPVTSGGNYTDQTGQQWVCDEIDLERGVRVQRVDKTAFDTTKSLAEQKATLATPIETPLTPAEIAAYKALTAYAPTTIVQASDGAGIRLGYQRDVNLVVKNLEDAIASMTTT